MDVLKEKKEKGNSDDHRGIKYVRTYSTIVQSMFTE